MSSLVERYSDQIGGTLSCLDRIVLTGTLPGVCHSEGMSFYLHKQQILLKDYPRFMEPLRDGLRQHIEGVASAGLPLLKGSRSSSSAR